MAKQNFTENYERIRSALTDANRQETIRFFSNELAALNATVHTLQEQLVLLRSFTELYPLVKGLNEETMAQLDLPSSYSVGASELLLPANGFYYLEYSENGTPYRWTGPQKNFSFTVWIDRARPLKLDLYCFGIGSSENASGLRAEIDGKRYAATPTPFGFTIAEIPVRSEPGPTTVAFDVPQMKLPSEGEGDRRILGISFHRLDLSPVV